MSMYDGFAVQGEPYSIGRLYPQAPVDEATQYPAIAVCDGCGNTFRVVEEHEGGRHGVGHPNYPCPATSPSTPHWSFRDVREAKPVEDVVETPYERLVHHATMKYLERDKVGGDPAAYAMYRDRVIFILGTVGIAEGYRSAEVFLEIALLKEAEAAAVAEVHRLEAEVERLRPVDPAFEYLRCLYCDLDIFRRTGGSWGHVFNESLGHPATPNVAPFMCPSWNSSVNAGCSLRAAHTGPHYNAEQDAHWSDNLAAGGMPISPALMEARRREFRDG